MRIDIVQILGVNYHLLFLMRQQMKITVSHQGLRVLFGRDPEEFKLNKIIIENALKKFDAFFLCAHERKTWIATRIDIVQILVFDYLLMLLIRQEIEIMASHQGLRVLLGRDLEGFKAKSKTYIQF
jgi:hypothetical protein